MKSEQTIIKIMHRFKCSREKVISAPDRVLEFIPEHQPKLSSNDLIWAQEVAKKYLEKIKNEMSSL